MLLSVSKFNPVNNVQSVFSKVAPTVVKNSTNDIAPKKENLSIADMANAIKSAASDENKSNLSFTEVFQMFTSGELDPRVLGHVTIKTKNSRYDIYIGNIPTEDGKPELGIIFKETKTNSKPGRKSGMGMTVYFSFNDYDKLIENTKQKNKNM